jgi:hypothetical protein
MTRLTLERGELDQAVCLALAICRKWPHAAPALTLTLDAWSSAHLAELLDAGPGPQVAGAERVVRLPPRRRARGAATVPTLSLCRDNST